MWSSCSSTTLMPESTARCLSGRRMPRRPSGRLARFCLAACLVDVIGFFVSRKEPMPVQWPDGRLLKGAEKTFDWTGVQWAVTKLWLSLKNIKQSRCCPVQHLPQGFVPIQFMPQGYPPGRYWCLKWWWIPACQQSRHGFLHRNTKIVLFTWSKTRIILLLWCF